MTSISAKPEATGLGEFPAQSAGSDMLTPQVYQHLAQLVYRHSRISLGPDKQQLVRSRLSKRRRDLDLPSFEAYCDLLRGGANSAEMAVVIELISTNHTYFFREPAHFELLRSQFLPELLARQTELRQGLRCWSAAASSGEEAFTLALTLAEFAREQGPLAWQIHGSDISARVLDVARRGIYAQSKLHLPDPAWFKRYFKTGTGPFEGQCQVRSSLRERVQFVQANLFDASYPIPAEQHLIFCRNVLIYFDQPSKQVLVDKLRRHLAINGLLIIGHSESLVTINHGLQHLGNGVYRRAR